MRLRRHNTIRERSRRRMGPCDIVEIGVGPAPDEPSWIEIRGQNNEAICSIFPHAGTGGVGTAKARKIALVIAGAFATTSGTEASRGEGLERAGGCDDTIAQPSAQSPVVPTDGAEPAKV